MTDHSLTVTCHTHPREVTVLAVAGELDHHTAARLDHAVHDAPFAPGAHVVLDLTHLTYCDSTGITVLVAAYHRARATESRVTYAGLNDDLMRVLRITGLDQVFTFRPTVEDAVGSPHA